MFPGERFRQMLRTSNVLEAMILPPGHVSVPECWVCSSQVQQIHCILSSVKTVIWQIAHDEVLPDMPFISFDFRDQRPSIRRLHGRLTMQRLTFSIIRAQRTKVRCRSTTIMFISLGTLPWQSRVYLRPRPRKMLRRTAYHPYAAFPATSTLLGI